MCFHSNRFEKRLMEKILPGARIQSYKSLSENDNGDETACLLYTTSDNF